MDKASIGGAFLAIAGIVAGLLIEGGNLGQILQPTAALIVFGGTLGAVLLQFPLTTVVAAFRSLGHLFAAPRKAGDATDSRAGGVCQQGAPARRGFARCRSAGHSGSVSEANADAGCGRHRARGTAQDHAREPGFAHRRRGAAARSVRIGRRLLAYHRHPGRRAGPDPGDAASGQHHRGGPRHRRGLCGDDLRRGHCQPLLSALRGQDAAAHPQRPPPARDDAGRRDFDSGRHESAHAGDQAGRLSRRRQTSEQRERAA